jgi:hypothetical protein
MTLNFSQSCNHGKWGHQEAAMKEGTLVILQKNPKNKIVMNVK